MSISAIGSTNPMLYRPQAIASTGTGPTALFTGDAAKPATTSSLSPVSAGALPAVRLTAEQLAMVQEGIRPPDPAQTAAEMNTRASALIRDAQTGQVLGGVWPGVAAVSAPAIEPDSRLSSASAADQVRYLAQDIEKATGKDVTIQYFGSSDPNAPTFGSNVIGSY